MQTASVLRVIIVPGKETFSDVHNVQTNKINFIPINLEEIK